MEYYLGVICGVALVLLIAFLVYKKLVRKQEYDERQMIGRGKAFQVGFFTTIIADVIVTILFRTMPNWGDSYLWHMLAICIGIAAFAVTAIHFDAYVSMTDTPKRFTRMGIFLMVAMCLCAVANFHGGDPEIGYINMMLMVVWIIIVGALILHGRKKAAAAEDEE